jgi:hypothetical protein
MVSGMISGAILLMAVSILISTSAQAFGGWQQNTASTLPNPILFVTQIPIPNDTSTIASVCGNQLATSRSCGRGGDLWILYPDGTTKNLTAAAGYGIASGFQGAGAYTVDWNASNRPSGIYYYRLTVGNLVDVKRMLLIK